MASATRPDQGQEATTLARTPARSPLVHKHALTTRIGHWLSALSIFILLGSGMMIFNAHPRLYWGGYGANADAAAFEIMARGDRGYTRLGSVEVETTGVLGLSEGARGPVRRAFPEWITIPGPYDLAGARHWHLLFAWVLGLAALIYLVAGFANGHIWRDLVPARRELRPKHLLHEVVEHAKLNFPKGEAARHYNTLQKLTYVAVLGVLAPLIVLTGLGMSPGTDAGYPFIVDLLGGRQSARTIHFIAASLIGLFIIVHLALVVLAGPIHQLRGMITGWTRLPREKIS